MTFEDDIPSWRALAGERLGDWKAERERRIKAEHDLIALQAEVDELWPYRKRAEKAEQERGEAKYSAEVAKRQRDNWESVARQALAEQPRPLTADDISDEMVERARNAPSFDGRLSPSPRLVREMLTAALTEPPARPEGAEKVEAVLHQYWSGDINGDELANRIAEEMNR